MNWPAIGKCMFFNVVGWGILAALFRQNPLPYMASAFFGTLTGIGFLMAVTREGSKS